MTLIFDCGYGAGGGGGGSGGSDGFAETFGENVYHLADDKDENGLIPFFTQNNTELVFDKIEKLPATWCGSLFLNNTTITSVSFPDLEDTFTPLALENMFSGCTNMTSISFPKLTSIPLGGSKGMCNKCTSLTSVSLPKLESSDGNESMFSGCTSLTSVSLPELKILTNCVSMFEGCSNLTSVSLPELVTFAGAHRGANGVFRGTAIVSLTFPKLTDLTASQAFFYAFRDCTTIADIYFPALTADSFGTQTNQFENMLTSTGTNVTHTLHFPSNLESKIQSLSHYPNFDGTSGYVTLAYDLPATE